MIDTAVFAIPAKFVAAALVECGEKQIPGAVLIPSGFAEAGAAELQAGDVEVEEAAEYLYQNGIPAYAYSTELPVEVLGAKYKWARGAGLLSLLQAGWERSVIRHFTTSRRVTASAFALRASADKSPPTRPKLSPEYEQSIRVGAALVAALPRQTPAAPAHGSGLCTANISSVARLYAISAETAS